MIQNPYGWRANLNRQAFRILTYDDLITPAAHHEGDANEEDVDTLLSGGVADKVCPTIATALFSAVRALRRLNRIHQQLQRPNNDTQMPIAAHPQSSEGTATQTPITPTSSELVFDSPVCGCLGCHDPAQAVIDHPRHGERVVCDHHAKGHEVIRRV